MVEMVATAEKVLNTTPYQGTAQAAVAVAVVVVLLVTPGVPVAAGACMVRGAGAQVALQAV